MAQASTPDHLESEIELYRNLAENACDLICQAGTTGRYLYASPNYKQVLGYDPKELLGQSLFKWVHPDDLAEVNRRFIIGLVKQQPAQLQFRYLHKNGEWRWLETSGKPFFGWRHQWRATFISRDITERRKIEEDLRRGHDFRNRVLNSTSNAIAALDSAGQMILTNPRMVELTGLSEKKLRGRNFISLLRAEDRPMVQEWLAEILIKKQTRPHCEVGLFSANGDERRLLLSLSPLRLDGGEAGAVLTAEDVTALREGARERESLLLQLQSSRRLEKVGALAAGVTHDFNNLLAGILTTTQLMQVELGGDPVAARLLATQQKAVERATALARQLLGLARPDNVVSGPVDLLSQIRQMADFCSTQFDRRIEVVDEMPPEMPSVWGETGALDQVMLNLFLNAGQALLPQVERGKKATITLRAQDLVCGEDLSEKFGIAPGQKMLRISIRDNGPGISSETLGRIFEPFFTTKATHGNHGLGLSTVFSIVKKHGGAVSVESIVGSGTAFHIDLPVMELERPQDATAQSTETVGT